MTPERYRQIRGLFEAALEQPLASRPAFLLEACPQDVELLREVQRLISAHEHSMTQTSTRGLPLSPGDWSDSGLEERMVGRGVGPYVILRELGRGGMGSVYLARRADNAFQKQVALKLVHPGPGTARILQRFQQEREILASLDHPNIARLLDGGSTPDCLPYMIME